MGQGSDPKHRFFHPYGAEGIARIAGLAQGEKDLPVERVRPVLNQNLGEGGGSPDATSHKSKDEENSLTLGPGP